MIIGNSNDPVYLKKITLKIWHLKDEIEAMVTDKIKNHGIAPEIAKQQVEAIYSKDKAGGAPIAAGGMIGEGPLDDSEDAMAAALAEDDGEDEMAKALAEAEADGDIEPSDEPETTPETEEPATLDLTSDDSSDDLIEMIIPKLEDDRFFVGRMMLAEIDIDKMFFFCDNRFLEGQSIVIEFEIPNKFILNGTIRYCREFNMQSRVIKKHQLTYRACVDFSFLKQGERTLLRDFLESIEIKVQNNKKAKKKPSNDDDLLGGDDDLGISELDDL